jgi:alpha-tubulin suppressor-like RCC1 family protein
VISPLEIQRAMGAKKKHRNTASPQPATTVPVHINTANDDFRSLYPRIVRAQQARTSAAQLVAELEAQLEAIRAKLETSKEAVVDADKDCVEADALMVTLRPRLCFRSDLPDCVALSILGSHLGHRAGGLAAMVCRGFRATVGKAMQLKLFKSDVLAICAGSSHTVACMQGGVYTFGSEENGQLGHGGNESELVPRVVEALAGKQVVGSAAGGDHSLVWTDTGELYTFGFGGSGRLGHGGNENEDVPRLVEALAGKHVVGAAAGVAHTVVLTDAGELYTFGYGDSGRLGHGGNHHHHHHELVPRVVEALVGKQVVGAAASGGHTLVWTDTGELYTFGYGHHGQLGHGWNENELVPRVVDALVGKQVVGAAADGNHTVVWTDAGELYTFGFGGFGQLGHGGNSNNELVPRVVEALVGKQVVGAAAGEYHSLVWTNTGEVYTFGDGASGQLGHGGNTRERVPRVVEALTGQRVVGAAAAGSHSVVWTDTGEVYTFGDDESGQLRHGEDDDGLVPRVVKALAMH